MEREEKKVSEKLTRARAVLAAQPFSVMLGAEITEYASDGVEIRLPINDDLKQQAGFVHGGVLSYLADNALTFAGGGSLEGQVVTGEFKINYIRPAVGSVLVARAKAISAGRTQAVTRCDIFVVKDGEERLCAAAQGTITVVRAVT
ncbi:MAG: PaaI family thioesterase [Hyphomicrobiaceae bacterium]